MCAHNKLPYAYYYLILILTETLYDSTQFEVPTDAIVHDVLARGKVWNYNLYPNRYPNHIHSLIFCVLSNTITLL